MVISERVDGLPVTHSVRQPSQPKKADGLFIVGTDDSLERGRASVAGTSSSATYLLSLTDHSLNASPLHLYADAGVYRGEIFARTRCDDFPYFDARWRAHQSLISVAGRRCFGSVTEIVGLKALRALLDSAACSHAMSAGQRSGRSGSTSTRNTEPFVVRIVFNLG